MSFGELMVVHKCRKCYLGIWVLASCGGASARGMGQYITTWAVDLGAGMAAGLYKTVYYVIPMTNNHNIREKNKLVIKIINFKIWIWENERYGIE